MMKMIKLFLQFLCLGKKKTKKKEKYKSNRIKNYFLYIVLFYNSV